MKGLREGRRSAAITVIALIKAKDKAEDQVALQKTEAKNKGKADYQEDHNKRRRESWKTQSVPQRNKNGISQK